jgi:hypothetical protein
MLILTKEDIAVVCSMEDAIEAVKEAFIVHSEGSVKVPLRINIRSDKYNGNMLFMPAYCEKKDAASLKIVSVYPDNKEKNLPSTPAQVLLIDPTTGIVLSIMDGTYITALRTGAASGAAFSVLAKSECKTGALIGTGTQAAMQLEAMIVSKNPKLVKVYSRNKDRLNNFVKNMSIKFKSKAVELVACESADAAVKDADILITATNSDRPLFSVESCKPGLTISAVGSFTRQMQELDTTVLKKASKIYYDDKEAMLEEAGEIIKALENRDIDEKKFSGSLGEALAGKIKLRENDEEIIVFKSVGLGTQDLVTAKQVYDNAISKNIGKYIDIG